MDADGARALAARIASGPPDDDPAPGARPRDETAVKVVYLRPVRAARREVKVFVRRPDGRLGLLPR